MDAQRNHTIFIAVDATARLVRSPEPVFLASTLLMVAIRTTREAPINKVFIVK